MKYNDAVRIAIEAMDEKYQRLAVAANLHEKYKLNDAAGLTASKERKAIREAKQVLKSTLPGVF